MTEQTTAYKVQRQLLAIFDHENVKKDQFFRELIEKDPEHCKIATLFETKNNGTKLSG
jgi:hypothetical protein